MGLGIMNIEHGMMNMEVIFKLYIREAFNPPGAICDYMSPTGTGIKNRISRNENRRAKIERSLLIYLNSSNKSGCYVGSAGRLTITDKLNKRKAFTSPGAA